MITCKKCNRQFPIRMFFEGKYRNFQHRKYCFDCSPFGIHNTQKLEQPINYVIDGKKLCIGCNCKKIIENFYTQKNRIRKFCKECEDKRTLERQHRFKKQCIEYKGGKCIYCGYNKCRGALEFHHKNPNEKDFDICKSKSKKFDKKVMTELDKCDLVCSNCHREIHNGLIV